MKVTLDLEKLLEEGKINQAEYDKFSQLSSRGTASLAFNLLIGFGVIAVSAASLALLPTPTTAIVVGLFVCAAGIAIVHLKYEQWTLLGNVCVVVGALMFGGGIVTAAEASVGSFLLLATVFAAAGVFAHSSLLIVLAVLALSSSLGARTDYIHATYFLGMKEPALTVVLFTIFSIATYQISKRVAADYQALAIAASRTSVFLVNFGFWIGSLWGDKSPFDLSGAVRSGIIIADWVFAMLWAISLVVAAVWAWKRNRRWLLNVVGVFGGIHFYTQWFERLGASPDTVMIAGVLALGFAIGLRAANTRMRPKA